MIEVQIKIKTKDGREFVLDNEDAKKIFEDLQGLYQTKKEPVYIPYEIRGIEPFAYKPFWTNQNGTSCFISLGQVR